MSFPSDPTHAEPPSWEMIAQQKRKERAAKIPREWLLPEPLTSDKISSPISLLQSSGLLSQRELNLTSRENHDATSLLQGLANGKITSTELVTTFCKRAALAHQLTNCLTEILFTEAIARAKALDAHFTKTGKTVGPLHGLPITFKDSYNIKGHDTSIGITSRCFDPSDKNSLLYDILTGYGAIVIAKTAVPQTMLNADTDSIVFGRTVNPYNRDFGAAGSTGGEGALLALGVSTLGIGSDGAGSVRMPAANFGAGVIGTTTFGPVTVTGFLGRSVRDVHLFARLSAEAKPWEKDCFLYPHQWQSLPLPVASALRIGVWSSNGFLHLHPPVARGFRVAQERLKGEGVELVEFNGPDISNVWELQKEWTELQGMSYLRELLSKEPHTEIVKATGIITKKTPPSPPTVEYIHSMNARINNFFRAMHVAWNRGGKPLDALLWVTAPHTAVPFDKYTYLGFTGLFNLIDWPDMALPLNMFADKAIDKKVPIAPFNDLDAEIQNLYDGDSFHGLPLAVHLIGRRFEDEKLLAVSEVVHDIIKSTDYRSKL
ncbi:hypothetical protein ASPCAL13322 [Aspergillus calidoustus]|uniref:Amidase domain-containing protein n=1 Tax=Aspergillus calidoustus TaxID=454130 RepID=A0A0U5GEC1_ASPCI|nr:hypothetical protein ASPCAL13322 [Aspergillus calidoustus]